MRSTGGEEREREELAKTLSALAEHIRQGGDYPNVGKSGDYETNFAVRLY
jgi:hypothetical protein